MTHVQSEECQHWDVLTQDSAHNEWCWRWKRGQVGADVPVIYSVMEKWLEEIKEAEKDVWKK